MENIRKCGEVLQASSHQRADRFGRRRRAPRPGATSVGPSDHTPQAVLEEARRGRASPSLKCCLGSLTRDFVMLHPQVFVEVFSGSGRLSRAVCQRGGFVIQWDIQLGSAYDLSKPEVQRLLRGWVIAGKVWGIHIATPCASFSIARGGWNPSLRSREFPLGLPDLNPRSRQQVDAGNLLARVSVGLVLLARRMMIPVTLENPASSFLFRIPSFRHAIELPGASVITTEFCMYGTPYRKSTTLIGFNVDLSALGQHRCIHKPRGRCRRTGLPHLALAGLDSQGNFKTASAQAYPRKLCTILVCCFINAIAEKRCKQLTMLLRA